MRKIVLTCVILSLILTPLLRAVGADDICTSWITEDAKARVEITKRDGLYFGRVVALYKPTYDPGEREAMDGKPRQDLENPNPDLRNRPIVGLEFMANFHFKDGKWVDGTIYDIESGKTYSCQMSIDAEGKLRLRGYIGIALFGRTTVWQRASSYYRHEMEFLGLPIDPKAY